MFSNEAAGALALAIFAVSVAFYSGMLTQRVVALEKWRSEMHQMISELKKEFKNGIDDLKNTITGL